MTPPGQLLAKIDDIDAEIDAEIDGLRDIISELARGPVYVEVEGHRWCHRHHALWIQGDGGCSGRHDSEDHGRCQPVPVYVEASDP